MSGQSSNTFSSSSYSYSSSSSGSNGQVSGHRSIHSTTTDSSGTRVTSAAQNLGEPIVQETRQYDPQGRELVGGGSTTSSRRIEDVSDEEQAKRDAEYEERIEEEYAKREGGA